MSRFQLQLIRWSSLVLSTACVVAGWAHPHRGIGLVLFFGMLILGAPGALITLHLYDNRR